MIELNFATTSSYVIWWRTATREMGSPEEIVRNIVIEYNNKQNYMEMSKYNLSTLLEN